MPWKLLVRGLGAATTVDRLTALFAQAGPVLFARLTTEPGSARRRGLVKMASADGAERAVSQLDGKELDGRVIRVQLVRWPVGRSSRCSIPQPDATDGAAAVDDVSVRARLITAGPAVSPASAPAVPVVLSFLVGARAFRYLVDHLRTLRPSGMAAVEGAQRRGCIAGSYYFLDAPDDVVRDVRNCLRRGAGPRGLGGKACDAAVSAVESRRRVAWLSSQCPRCGGRLRPPSWLLPGALGLVCRDCRWSMPE
jgi:hypothetical protein